jgi:thiamine-phosphate pyrophosphorylase
MPNYSTYLVAGPENILPNHQLGNESKEQALIRIVQELSNNGLNVFQLRAKNISDSEQIDILRNLKKALLNTQTKICINDSVNVASKAGDFVDILHLGQSDMHPEKAKSFINDRIKIGLSITKESHTRNIPDCVSYIGVGPIYKTNSKNDAEKPIGETILKQILEKVNIPVVAIGGIDLNNVSNLFSLGVSGVAVISNILNNENPLKNFLLLKEKIKKE